MSTTTTLTSSDPTLENGKIDPPISNQSLGYNTRLAAPLKGAKLFQFFFKKGHVIKSIVLEGADFDEVRIQCEAISTHFGVRYVSLRPFVFSATELLKLPDLPNYV